MGASAGHSLNIHWFAGFTGLSPYAWPAAILAALLMTVAFVMVAAVGRRRFYRRNHAGVEQFRGYGHAVSTRLAEGLFELVAMMVLMAAFVAGSVAVLGFMAASGQ